MLPFIGKIYIAVHLKQLTLPPLAWGCCSHSQCLIYTGVNASSASTCGSLSRERTVSKHLKGCFYLAQLSTMITNVVALIACWALKYLLNARTLSSVWKSSSPKPNKGSISKYLMMNCRMVTVSVENTRFKLYKNVYKRSKMF